jgi:ferritin-like metal-binding protein YciE
MKTRLNSLNEMLTFQLDGMYYAEKLAQKALPDLARYLDSAEAAEIISKYVESASDKRLKLKRIFSYLLTGPFKRNDGLVEKVLAEAAEVIDTTTKGNCRDIMIISALEAMCEYKMTSYNTALKFALQMELTKVAELLEDVIAWEVEAAQEMSDFVSKGVTEYGSPANAGSNLEAAFR